MPDPSRTEPPPELLEAFAQGKGHAAAELAGVFFEPALRFCRSLLGEEDLAQDAVQETFLRLLERHRLYNPTRPFRPWFFTVARNVCLELLRARKSVRARIEDLTPSDDEVRELAAQIPPPWEELFRQELEAQAEALLRALPEDARTVVLLHLVEGLTFQEIGEAIGRPSATAATIYYRTLQRLRRASTAQVGSSRHAAR